MLDTPPGLVVVEEYGAVAGAEAAAFGDADLGRALLEDAGIEATLAYDPALRSSAQYWATDRVIRLLVPEAVEEEARRVLDEAGQGLPPEFAEPDGVADARRHAWHARRRRAGLVVAFLVLGAPLLVAMVAMAVAELSG